MNIKHHLKSVILASALVLSFGAIATSFANTQGYQVINVATWDALNMRSGPGTGFDIVGSIPANTNGIALTNEERDVGGSLWVKVIWNGQTGWVNKRFLTIAKASVNPDNVNITYGTQHTHPATRCTSAITHSHSGPAGHTHSYSCNNNTVPTVPLNNMKQTYYNPNNTDIYGNQRVVFTNNNIQNNNPNTHTHPANQCTRSKTHTHANGAVRHTHRYSCGGRGRSAQQVTQQYPTYYGSTNLQHTHTKSQCASAISHSHKNGDTIHRHECPTTNRGRRSSTGWTHTHPANSLTRATTHSHPYQDPRHTHFYGRR